MLASCVKAVRELHERCPRTVCKVSKSCAKGVGELRERYQRAVSKDVRDLCGRCQRVVWKMSDLCTRYQRAMWKVSDSCVEGVKPVLNWANVCSRA